MKWPTAVFLSAAILSAGCRESDDPPPEVMGPTATSLTYPNNPAVYVVGQAIAPNVPQLPFQVNAFDVTPALPQGLVLDPVTGTLSGTPLSERGPHTYTVMATSSSASASAGLSITVLPGGATAGAVSSPISDRGTAQRTVPHSLTYPQSDYSFVVGREVEALAPSVVGAVNSYRVEPALPDGLTLDPATGAIAGTPTVARLAQEHLVTAVGTVDEATAVLRVGVRTHDFFEDLHADGEAGGLRLVGLHVGRVVDVYDFDSSTGRRALQRSRFVVAPNLNLQPGQLELTRNPVTYVEELTVMHRADSDAFAQAVQGLDDGLVPVQALAPDDLGVFTMVQRNAALVLRFDDLLDADTVSAETVELAVNGPPVVPFEGYLTVDRNYGGMLDRDADGVAEFYGTRVVLDLTVSELEAAVAELPLPVNLVGLPPALETSVANALLRLATTLDVGGQQTQLLSNVAGNPLVPNDNGPTDPLSDTHDVIRAFRSGGDADVTGDPYSGFLSDVEPPRIVGQQAVTLQNITPAPASGTDVYVVDLVFQTAGCAQTPAEGDVVQQGQLFLEVQAGAGPPSGGTVTGVSVLVLAGDPGTLSAAPAALFSPYDPVADAGFEACLLRFTPAAGSAPADGVSPLTAIDVRTSEPLSPAGLSPFEGAWLASAQSPGHPSDYVVTQNTANTSLASVRLSPLVPLPHAAGQTESYFVHFAAQDGLRDLAGNGLAHVPPPIEFRLDAGAAAEDSGNFALLFEQVDEDGDGAPEVRGQFLYDLAQGLLRPRPVIRYSVTADRTHPVTVLMTPFGPGTQTPLSPLGSKLQTVWRYHDVGLSLMDDAQHNLDVERLYWSPVGGAVAADSYTEFEMRLSHSSRLPEEMLEFSTFLPRYPGSGLTATYADNQLEPTEDPQKVVHPRERGYALNPADVTTSASGIPLMPFPMNRDLPVSEFETYTWRDTALTARAGADSAGVETEVNVYAAGLSTAPGGAYGPGEVPSIGLPLLLEFRTFPDGGALGLNAFDISLAINTSARPNFRAYSTGGVNTFGQVVLVDPSAQPVATGGFNPNSVPPGQPLMPAENAFYHGQADIVVRVSRVHSAWFDTGFSAPNYVTQVAVPAAHDQPAGTEVAFAWRGATSVDASLLGDATTLDPYGDATSGALVTFLGGDAGWKDDPSDVDGARYFQFRASFLSNTETLVTPELRSVGVAFFE